MPVLQDIEDFFSIFHDGSISAWSGNRELLTLTVDCRYLAERIDPAFTQFSVVLSGVTELSFETWPLPPEILPETFYEPYTVFAAALEILSAAIKNEAVEVICEQFDSQFPYRGGILRLHCAAIRVYDQAQREIRLEELEKVCHDYWNRL